MSNLHILTYNTRKSPDVVSALLNDFNTANTYDLLLLQEPPKKLISNSLWTTLHTSSHHPLSPARALIYINARIDPRSYNQLLIPNCRDLVALDLKSGEESIRIVNIYNPPNSKPDDSEYTIPLLLPLLQLPLSRQLLLISGDFNLHHPNWEPQHSSSISPTASATELAELIAIQDLSLLLPPGTVTYEKGETSIDLVLGNSSTQDRMIRCTIAHDADKASDHLPIHTELRLSPDVQEKEERYNFKKVDVALLNEVYLSSTDPTLPTLDSTTSIDEEADSLSRDIQAAIHKTVPLQRPSPFSERWWTPNLSPLVDKARQARTYHYSHPYCDLAKLRSRNAQKQKKAAIKLAKNQFWKTTLETVDDKTLWKVVKSLSNKSTVLSIPPLLQPNGDFALSLTEKILLLKSVLLPAMEPEEVLTELEEDLYVEIESVDGNLDVEVEEGERGDEGKEKEAKEVGNFFRVEESQNIFGLSSKKGKGKVSAMESGVKVSPLHLYAALRDSTSTILEDREANLSESVLNSQLHISTSNGTTSKEGVVGVTSRDNVSVVEIGLKVSTFHQYAASPSTSSTILEGREVNLSEPNPISQFVDTLSDDDELSDASLDPLYLSQGSDRQNSTTFSLKTGESLPKFSNRKGQKDLGKKKLNSTTTTRNPVESTPNSLPHPSSTKSTPSSLDWFPLTDDEAREGIFSAKPTSAGGPDKIPNSILRALWPSIGPRVANLYRACVEKGYHPTSWKEILAIVLRKPNKDDYSLPKSYRLISLIKTIAKGLENCMAKRLSYITEKYNLLPKQHMGGRPSRSCQDALIDVTSTIGEHWRKGEVVVGVALDAKAAFPSVNSEILQRNLLRAGVPPQLVAWVKSFLEDRTCYFVVEGTTSAKMCAKCGLPQGSPICPLLYLYYIAPLLTIFETPNSSSIGYIDDQFALFWGKTINEAASHLTAIIPRIEAWCTDHRTGMEGDKSKLILFSKRHAKNLHPLPPIILNGAVIPEVKSLTILGGILDTKLSFKELTNKSVANGLKAIGGLSALAKSTKGLSFRSARQLVIACVLTKLDYLSPLWHNPQKASTLIVTKFDSVLRLASKLITGGFLKAGVDALSFEAFLYPTVLRLNRNSFRAATRILTLPPSHPLQSKMTAARLSLSPKTNPSAIELLVRAFPLLSSPLQLETISPALIIAPWEKHKQPITHISSSKELATQYHNSILVNAKPSSIFIYSDGSLLDGSTGAGMAIRLKESEVEGRELLWGKKSVGMGQQQTVYAGELKGINLGLTTLLDTLPLLDNIERTIYLFVDNQSAVRNACDPFKGPGQLQRSSNRKIWMELTSRYPLATLNIIWVPGHVSIEGNELADVAAKEGAESRWEEIEEEEEEEEVVVRVVEKRGSRKDREEEKERSELSRAEKVFRIEAAKEGFLLDKSVSAVNAEYDGELKREWGVRWKGKREGGRLRQIDHSNPGAHSLRLHEGLNRRHSSILTQLRTGSSHLNAYLFKLRLRPSPLCECGELETRHHFFFSCRIYYYERQTLRRSLGHNSFDLSSLLTDLSLRNSVLQYINNTNRFPRYFDSLLERDSKVKKRATFKQRG